MGVEEIGYFLRHCVDFLFFTSVRLSRVSCELEPSLPVLLGEPLPVLSSMRYARPADMMPDTDDDDL
jgi:hypothetical protein